jgi:ubiquinone/menaquinone biosynthesis C-methylase UbiE
MLQLRLDTDGLCKVNWGSGKDTKAGWNNVDIYPHKDVCYVADITKPMPDMPSNYVERMYLSHVLEHITNPLPMLQEFHRIAKPNCELLIRTPYGSSDNAWEDPTHVRPYFLGSFNYFSQAAYGAADYGYRGDWETVERTLILKDGTGIEQIKDNLEAVLSVIMVQRNLVEEIQVTMRAVKPIREAGTFVESSPINFQFP